MSNRLDESDHDVMRCVECGEPTTRTQAKQFSSGICAECEGELYLASHDPDKVVSTRMAAQIAGVHENTIRNWHKSGLLPEAMTMSTSRFKRWRVRDVQDRSRQVREFRGLRV